MDDVRKAQDLIDGGYIRAGVHPKDLAEALRRLDAPAGRFGELDEITLNEIVRDVAELPDRDSPDWWPEAMLVTGEELKEIIRERLAYPRPASPPTKENP